MNWKKIIGWVLAVAVVVEVVAFNMHQQQSNTTGKRKVYAIVQLTGPIAEAGKHVKAASAGYTFGNTEIVNEQS